MSTDTTRVSEGVDAELSDVTVTGADWLMGQIAVALGSTLDLREVLHTLARLGRGVTGARHCVVFLLEDGELRPAAAVGAEPDREMWAAVQRLGPIRVDDDRRTLLEALRPVGIADASQSTLIPAGWQARFGPGAVVLAPLHASGIPCGLLAVEWANPRSFRDAELSMLESLGRYAGIAVRNARLYEASFRRARHQEALTRAAAALAAAAAPDEMAEVLAEAATTLLGAKACAIGLFDAERSAIVTLSARGAGELCGPLEFSAIPPRIVELVTARWSEEKRPLRFAVEPFFDRVLRQRDEPCWYQLVPLVGGDRTEGLMLFAFPHERRLDEEDLSALLALADVAAANLDRCRLSEAQALATRRLEVLYEVSALLRDGADIDALVEQVNRLLADRPSEVVGIAVSDATIRRFVGGEVMADCERRGPLDTKTWPEVTAGVVSVPMRLGGRTMGALRLRTPALDTEERAFLEALARGLADLVYRHALQCALDHAARERAIVDERQRLAGDLHDTVGQLFVAIGLAARQQAGRLGAGSAAADALYRVADMADGGKRRIEETTRDLAFAPAIQHGLVPAVERLVADVARDSGLRTRVQVRGTARRLDPDAERALFRVVHESVTNAWRHAHCRTIAIALQFTAEVTRVLVTDDGRGLPMGKTIDGMGTAGMERAMREVGGSVEIAPAPTRGVRVAAVVPAGRP